MEFKSIGPRIECNPPFTMVLKTAGGVVWVHHVDVEGKSAGGVYNGTPYASISELFDQA